MIDCRPSARLIVRALTLAASMAAPIEAALAQAPSAPAEIQPGHPAPPTTGSTGAPQQVTPPPLPGGSADTPGGAARNGVIAPPAPAADAAINRGAPATTLGTPIIPPPGSPGGNPAVVPK